MPKGKTNAPLNILVTDERLHDSAEMQALQVQGHNVCVTTAYSEYDRIYGPNCYRMTKDLLPFLPLSLKEARLEKKGKVKQ